MQQHAPWSYYGYHRKAQIHVIRGEYIDAFKAYLPAFDTVTLQHELEVVHKLVNDAAHMLDQVASELGKNSKFNDAHRIANLLIDSLPKSSIGYLCAGALFLLQCHNKKAIRVYDQAIAVVNDEHERLAIVDCKRKVELQVQRTMHLDFITRAPIEIAFNIIRHFDRDQCLEYMHVCKGWQERIFQCPAPWRVLEIDAYRTVKSPIQTRKHVQDIHFVEIFYKPEIAESWLKLIGDREFKKLVSISMHDTVMPRNIHLLTRAFSATNLTCLKLAMNHTDTPLVPFHVVLNTCPYLKHLEYTRVGTPVHVESTLLPAQPTRISQLGIGSSETGHDDIDYETLLQLFPHLKTLYIPNCTPQNVLTIMRRCPDLQTVQLGYPGSAGCIGCAEEKGAYTGLRYLKVTDQCLDPESIATITTPHINTLEELVLEYPCRTEDQDDDGGTPGWMRFPDIDSSTLRSLTLRIGNDYSPKQWIGDCPALAYLTLNDMKFMDDTVFEGLKKLPNLRQLTLSKCNELTQAGIYDFFDDLSRRPEKSLLHTLTLDDMVTVNIKTLSSVANLRELHALNIINCHWISGHAIAVFAAAVKENDGLLEQLGLDDVRDVTGQILSSIVYTLPRLKNLNVARLESVDQYTISRLVHPESARDISIEYHSYRIENCICDCTICKSRTPFGFL
ncbi:hypothetical protein BJV82DRAFT_578045 [Fennellomyces sp. T-0311]|nr:hypothetical protein BJV82DRAFT_578045 [Fennellomyces sp. T-0311]